MPFLGRYHLIRKLCVSTMELSGLYVLDRRNLTILPYKGNPVSEVKADKRECELKLERFRRRLWAERTADQSKRLAARLSDRDADCNRLCAIFDQHSLFLLKAPINTTSLTSTSTLALDSNYVAGTSGDANAMRFWSPNGGKTLDKVYFHISSYTGTAANVNDINLEVRAENSTGANIPNTSATIETKTSDPASATGWIATTGWTAALAAMSRYFIIVGDADGNGTDFATITARAGIQLQANLDSIIRSYTCFTTGGWASGNNTSTSMPFIVLAFSDGTVYGNPLTAGGSGSGTDRRGIRITASGLVRDMKIFGIGWTTPSGNISGIEIYNNANNPGTSPDHTSTDIGFAEGLRSGCFTTNAAPYTLSPGTAYRIVATYSASSAAGPTRLGIGTGEDATLRLAMPGNGEWYYTLANGTTDWSGDLVGSLPLCNMLVDGEVAPNEGPIASSRFIGGGIF